MTAYGPTLPTCALQRVGSYLGYTGHAANVVAMAALDPNLPPTVHRSSPTTSLSAATLLPVQKIANGLSGDPVPFSMRSGAAENRNS